MDAARTRVLALAESVTTAIATLDVGVISDDDLREVLIVTERATRQLQALQAETINQMCERARTAPGAGAHDRPDEFVVDEVAVLLSCTRPASGMRLATAWQASRFPALLKGWHDGDLDATKVRLIADGVAPLTERAFGGRQLVTDAVVQDLVEAAAEYATDHTTGQVRRWLNRRVVTVDPEAAERRRQRAMTERRVVVTPDADGMSQLWALLPSVAAQQIHQVLTAVAHRASHDDPRTTDQRRADALCDLVAGRLTPPEVATSLVLTGTVDASGRVALDPCGELAGVGTLTTAQVVSLLGAQPSTASAGATTRANAGKTADPRALPCDATGALVVTAEAVPRYRPSRELDRQIRQRDLTCRFPGCRRSAVAGAGGVDVDHTVPWPHGPTAPANLACLCRRHHRLKHRGDWALEQVGEGVLRWTTPTGRTVTTRPWTWAGPPRAP